MSGVRVKAALKPVLLTWLLGMLPGGFTLAEGGIMDYLFDSAEPSPIQGKLATSTTAEPVSIWEQLQAFREVEKALIQEGFQNVSLLVDDLLTTLRIDIYHPRISDVDRIIGRSARIANSLLPDSITQLDFCLLNRGVYCSQCYGLPRYKADRYFRKLISRWQLSQSLQNFDCEDGNASKPVEVLAVEKSTEAMDRVDLGENAGVETELMEITPETAPVATIQPETNMVSTPQTQQHRSARAAHVDNDILSGYTLWQKNRFSLRFNPIEFASIQGDQQGNFYLDINSNIEGEFYLFQGLNLDFQMFYRWLTPDDDIDSPEPTLPPVRSAIDLYRSERQIKLNYARLNYTKTLGKGSLLSTSLGYQDEMFAGLRSQWYFPEVTSFMDLELAADWLVQRKVSSPHALDDYDVISPLAGLHFYTPSRRLQLSLYAGDFLAEDRGVRYELSHRFNGGAKLGLWYSRTQSDDLSNPAEAIDHENGGLFIEIPLSSIKRKDTRKKIAFEYMPEIKDGGQKLQPLVNSETYHWGHRQGPLKQFGQ